MAVDWYGASVRTLPDHLKAALFSEFGGSFVPEPPRQSFANGLRHDVTQARLLWGGRNSLPFLEASGDASPMVSDFLRRAYPAAHFVSRVDVCLDYQEPGSFDRIAAIARGVAAEKGVAKLFIGDPDPESRKGRTWYFGSKTSDVRVRLYEKGLKALREGFLGVSEHWTRLELTLRPRKDRKALCASLELPQLWGLSRWSADLLRSIDGAVVPFRPDPSIRASSDERALDFMCRQYGAVIRRFETSQGKAAAIREIWDRLPALDWD